MLIARRLYVYFISAVSLAMWAFGLANLLSLALSRIAEALGGSVMQESAESVRQELSLWAAFVIVAFPVWLLHWWLAERAVHRSSPEGEQERASSIRSLYLAIVFGVLLIFLTIGSVDVVGQLLRGAFNSSSLVGGGGDQIWTSLSIALVSGSIMAYHGWVRRRDTQRGELEDAAVWLPRLYVYVAAFVGAMLLLFGIGDLIRVVDDALFGTRDIYYLSRWWADPLSGAIARTLVGVIIWAVHWDWSLRSLRTDDWLGASERRSTLRWFYVYAIVFVGILFTLNGVVSSLDAFLRLILNAPRNAPGIGTARAIIEPLLVAIPFAGFWAYHRLVVLNAAPSDEYTPFAPSLRRLYTYLVAFIGLAFTAIGAAWVLGILIDLLLGGSRTISISSVFWREDVARYSAFAIVGAGAWLWHWNAVERRVAAGEADERGATTRRIYLYLTLAATLVAMLVSLAIVIYRAISALLGVTSGTGLVSAVSTALGIVIVVGILFGYHLIVLRHDLELRETPSVTPGVTRVPLMLVAPPDANVESAVSQLRAHLPEGFVLESGESRKVEQRLPAPSQRLERDHA